MNKSPDSKQPEHAPLETNGAKTDGLQSLLNTLCSSVTLNQQNALQSLYHLADAQDAKLAYDLLAAAGVDVRYFAEPDGSGGKLYVQNASAQACESKIADSLAQAALFKQMKELIGHQPRFSGYTLSFANTPSGRQLTLLLPPDKADKQLAPRPTPAAATSPRAMGKAPAHPAARKKDDSVLGGPAVARAAIPKSMKTSDTGEDPLSKRIFFFLTGRAFTGGAWIGLFALALGVIFTVVVTVRAFLCPDIAGVQDRPAYCPQKTSASSNQQ